MAFEFGLSPIVDDSSSEDSDYDDADSSSSSSSSASSMHIGRTLMATSRMSDEDSSDYLSSPSAAEEKEMEEDKEASLLRGMDLSSVLGMMDAMKQRNTLQHSSDLALGSSSAMSDYEDIVRLMTGSVAAPAAPTATSSSMVSRAPLIPAPTTMARAPSVDDYLVSTFATVSTLSTSFLSAATGAGSASSTTASATLSSAASSSSSSLSSVSDPTSSASRSAAAVPSAMFSGIPATIAPVIVSGSMSGALPRHPPSEAADRIRSAKSTTLWGMNPEELTRRKDILERTERRILAEKEKVSWLIRRKQRQEDWGPLDLKMWLSVMNEESEYKGSIDDGPMRKLCEFIDGYQMSGKDFIYQMNDMVLRKIVGLQGSPLDDRCRKSVMLWVNEMRTSEEEKRRRMEEEKRKKAAEEQAKREAERQRVKREEEDRKRKALERWNEMQAQSGCPICYGKEDSYLLSPCNHAGFCLSCASQFIDSRCPFCKRAVDSVEKVFYVTQQLVKDDP